MRKTTTIPFCDLSRAHAPLEGKILEAIKDCIERSSYLRGPATVAFEEAWAAYCGQAYAVCCNSGTDALTLAALVLGMQQVAVQSNTLPLTAIGLHRGGAEVNLVDINAAGWPLETAMESVPVLIYGQIPTDAPVSRLYDAAHAHGWQPPAGSSAAWSFYPTKTLGAMGDAGAVTTHDRHFADELRKLCGRDDQFYNGRQLTSRMDEIQAAILLVKLKYLNGWLEERQHIGSHYDRRLGPLGICLNATSLHHLYVIKTPGRADLVRHLSTHGIQTKLHWETPLHQLPGPWRAVGSFSESEHWCSSVLSLPCYPGLTHAEVDFICSTIEAWFETRGTDEMVPQR